MSQKNPEPVANRGLYNVGGRCDVKCEPNMGLSVYSPSREPFSFTAHVASSTEGSFDELLSPMTPDAPEDRLVLGGSARARWEPEPEARSLHP